MSQVTYMAPVEEVRGKLCMNRGNGSVMVTRRKCYGKTKNGTPRLGPKEMYTSPKSLQMVTAAMKLKDACSLEEKL